MVNALTVQARRLWISNPPRLLTFSEGKFAQPSDAARAAAGEVLCAAADEEFLCLGT